MDGRGLDCTTYASVKDLADFFVPLLQEGEKAKNHVDIIIFDRSFMDATDLKRMQNIMKFPPFRKIPFIILSCNRQHPPTKKNGGYVDTKKILATDRDFEKIKSGFGYPHLTKGSFLKAISRVKKDAFRLERGEKAPVWVSYYKITSFRGMPAQYLQDHPDSSEDEDSSDGEDYYREKKRRGESDSDDDSDQDSHSERADSTTESTEKRKVKQRKERKKAKKKRDDNGCLCQ